MMKDINGRDIDLGDTVLYVGVGYGRALPPLCFGRVAKVNKASFNVVPLNPDLSEKMREEIELVETGETNSWGYPVRERVSTGIFVPVEQENVKFFENRFYVV